MTGNQNQTIVDTEMDIIHMLDLFKEALERLKALKLTMRKLTGEVIADTIDENLQEQNPFLVPQVPENVNPFGSQMPVEPVSNYTFR